MAANDRREAHWACVLMAGEAWGAAIGRPVVEGSEAALAGAIGGSAGWIEAGECALWLAKALREIDPGKPPAPRAAGRRQLMFLLDAVEALRDGGHERILDSDPSRWGSPRSEYVFCVSDEGDCERLGELRVERGLEWDRERVVGCALEAMGAMEQAFSHPEADPRILGVCAAEMAMRLSFLGELRPKLLSFLLRWSPRMGSMRDCAEARMACRAWEGQGEDDEACDLACLQFDWAAMAPSSGRTEFPWGLWLAWGSPSLAEEWGEALGARWDEDAALARTLAAMPYDRDEWGEGETEAALAAAALLERISLSKEVGPASAPSSRRAL